MYSQPLTLYYFCGGAWHKFMRVTEDSTWNIHQIERKLNSQGYPTQIKEE